MHQSLMLNISEYSFLSSLSGWAPVSRLVCRCWNHTVGKWWDSIKDSQVIKRWSSSRNLIFFTQICQLLSCSVLVSIAHIQKLKFFCYTCTCSDCALQILTKPGGKILFKVSWHLRVSQGVSCISLLLLLLC